MKQHNTLRGNSLLEDITDYALTGGKELGQAALGCVWIGFLLCFLMFFYTYNKYYREGVTKKDKSYHLA
jgi:hypothetical protein